MGEPAEITTAKSAIEIAEHPAGTPPRAAAATREKIFFMKISEEVPLFSGPAWPGAV
jgi:hypothetical protein